MITQRLSAHIGYLFCDLPLEARVAAAADAGFTAVEHPQPFAIEPARLLSDLREHALVFSQIAAGVGDTSRGEKGLAALPGREDEFRESLRRSVDYALEIGCPLIHPMAGVPSQADSQEAKRTYLRNIDFAVELTSALPLKVLIEAISHAAVPGYHIAKLEQAVTVQDIFGPGYVALLVDTYHAAANGFDLISWTRGNSYRIGHVHIADHPGRHEPGTGQFQFQAFLTVLTSEDYAGAIGFEYVPCRDTSSGLGFLDAWKNGQVISAGATPSDFTARGSI